MKPIMRLLAIAALAIGAALPAYAQVTLNLSFNISAPMTSESCPFATSYPANAIVCTIPVSSGTVVLSGANASSFVVATVGGNPTLEVGPTALASGTYAVTIAAGASTCPFITTSPTGQTIQDSASNTWSFGALYQSPNYFIDKNGSTWAGGSGTEIKIVSGTAWVQNGAGSWYMTTSTGYTAEPNGPGC